MLPVTVDFFLGQVMSYFATLSYVLFYSIDISITLFFIYNIMQLFWVGQVLNSGGSSRSIKTMSVMIIDPSDRIVRCGQICDVYTA